MNALGEYIKHNGILLCNENLELPSLIGLGFGWRDIVELIESHEVFYCLAYKGRSTYLSPRAYFLISRCREKPPLDEASERVYRALASVEPAEKDMLRKTALSGMDKKTYDKAFSSLLKKLYITAVSNGKWLNPNFSSFMYCTAERWEQIAALDTTRLDSLERELYNLLGKTMSSKNLNDFIGRKLRGINEWIN